MTVNLSFKLANLIPSRIGKIIPRLIFMFTWWWKCIVIHFRNCPGQTVQWFCLAIFTTRTEIEWANWELCWIWICSFVALFTLKILPQANWQRCCARCSTEPTDSFCRDKFWRYLKWKQQFLQVSWTLGFKKKKMKNSQLQINPTCFIGIQDISEKQHILKALEFFSKIKKLPKSSSQLFSTSARRAYDRLHYPLWYFHWLGSLYLLAFSKTFYMWHWASLHFRLDLDHLCVHFVRR